MAETLFAVLDADGVVENVIVADQEFIDSLSDAIADPDTNTGTLTPKHRFVDVTNVDGAADGGPGSAIGIGWKKAKNGRWVAPTPPEPTQAELDARAAAEAQNAQRAADDEFLAAVQAKVNAGTSLTQDERDRLTLINASRAGA